VATDPVAIGNPGRRGAKIEFRSSPTATSAVNTKCVAGIALWRAGEKPKLVQQVLEGDIGLSA
jgi:hypothetical protein